MVQLEITLPSSGNKVFLDIGDVSIKANYSAVEIQDITKRKAESTQSFSLPFTSNNNKYLGHFYNVNATSEGFDVNKRLEATIFVDGVEVLSGYLQLIKVNNKTEVYEVLVLGEVANIIKSLGDKKLSDIDFSEYNHTFNRQNIYDSWNGAITYTDASTGDEILYPIIDYGYDLTKLTDGDSDRLTADRLKPAMKVQTIFLKILADAGYSVTSTFLGTNFFTNQYMTLCTTNQVINNGQADGFRVYHEGTTQTINDDDRAVIHFQNDSGTDSYNLNDNYITDASDDDNNYYDVPASGKYKFKVRLKITPVNTNPTTNRIKYYLTLRAGESTSSARLDGVTTFGRGGPALIVTNGEPNSTGFVEFISDQIELKDTDRVYFHLERPFADPGDAEQTQILADSYVQLLEAPIQYIGTTVDLSEDNNILPQEKQVDFLMSIINRYNLIIENDKDNPKKLNIEPVQDYYDAGTSKDWTDKLDLSKNIVIRPTHEFQNDKVILSDLEDEDWMCTEAQGTNNAPYNSFEVKFPNEFTNGSDLEIKSIFSGFATYNIGGMRMAQLFRWDNSAPQFVKTKPKLFYYSGKKSCPPYRFYTETGSSSFDYKTEYPFCSTFSMAGDEIEATDFDIRFKSLESFGESDLIANSTTNDVYNLYWSRYLNSIYNPDARILVANFKLNANDIADFKFNDKIFIKDAYYRINKIKSYSLGKDITTQVELIKIVDIVDNIQPALDCNLKVNDISAYGFVTFVTESGISASATRECCEGLGYVYSSPTIAFPYPICSAKKSNDSNIETPPIVLNNSTIEIGEEGQTIIIEGGNLTSNITGTLTGDVLADDGTLVLQNGTDGTDSEYTGDVTGDLTGNVTATSVLADGVTATTQPLNTNNTTVATTEFVIANAGSGGTTPPAGSNTQVQYNDNGSFGAHVGFYFDASTVTVHATKFDATNLEGALTSNSTLTNGVTATTQTAGDSTTKVATTEFVTDAISNAAGTPAGANYQIQYYDNAGFGATSEVTINPTSGYITAEGLILNDTTANTYAFWNNGDTALAGTITAIASSTVTLSGISPASTPESNVVGISSTGQLFKQPAGSGGTPASPNLSVQFNDNGSFGGDAKFKYDSTNNILFVGDKVEVDGALEVGDFPISPTTYGATGTNAFAQGSNTTASGGYAVALNNTTTASALDSVAMGENSVASGRQSLAGGYECTASGSASVSFGALTTASGERAICFGANSTASGTDAVVMGFNHSALGDRTLTIGYENVNRASNGFVMGQDNTLNNLYANSDTGAGTGCFVGGYQNVVRVNDSIVFGSNCDAGVTSAGNNNSKNQFIFGLGLAVPKNLQGDAAGQSQTVVGRYNLNENQEHLLFSVGSGTDASNRDTALVVNADGKVGIQNITPTYTLDVTGDARKSVGGSSWATTSDERVKKNVRPYEKGLSEIIQIETKVFNYNGKAGTIDDSKDNVGVIAQEILKVFPNTVEGYNSKLEESDEQETEVLSFNPDELTYALINSVKELNAQIVSLKAEIQELKNK